MLRLRASRSLALALIAWSAGCGTGRDGCPTGARRVEERTADSRAQFCALPGGARHGPYEIRRAGGTRESGHYRLDRRDGPWIASRDGRLEAQVTYSAELADCGDSGRNLDCRHGDTVEYDRAGTLWGVTPWVRGRRHGWAVRFEPGGGFRGAVCFEDGELALEVWTLDEMSRTSCPREPRARGRIPHSAP